MAFIGSASVTLSMGKSVVSWEMATVHSLRPPMSMMRFSDGLCPNWGRRWGMYPSTSLWSLDPSHDLIRSASVTPSMETSVVSWERVAAHRAGALPEGKMEISMHMKKKRPMTKSPKRKSISVLKEIPKLGSKRPFEKRWGHTQTKVCFNFSNLETVWWVA